MRRVLITCVGGDVANAVVRCLAEEGDMELFGCDIKEYVPDMRLMQYYIVPRYDSDQYWTYLQSLLLSLRITHFIPISERELTIMDAHRDFFQENHIKAAINHTNIIQIFASKYKTALELSAHGIRVPKTYLPLELPVEIIYPLIVKPDFGCGSQGVSVVQNDKELQAAVKNICSPVIQEYIGSADDEYTMGVFSDGEITHSICFKRILGLSGLSVQVCTDTSEETRHIAENVAAAIQLRGAINIQMRKRNDQYYIFEINPRISSTVGFRYKLGFKDVIWWLDILDKKAIPKHCDIPNNIVGVRCLCEQIIFP